MEVEISWGDMWARVGLVMGDWDVLDHSIKLGFENKVVERNLVALGGVGSSLGMAGALLDG